MTNDDVEKQLSAKKGQGWDPQANMAFDIAMWMLRRDRLVKLCAKASVTESSGDAIKACDNLQKWEKANPRPGGDT